VTRVLVTAGRASSARTPWTRFSVGAWTFACWICCLPPVHDGTLPGYVPRESISYGAMCAIR
jgi:hypothetical protein